MNELVPINQPLDVMTLGEVLQRSGYFTDVKDAAQAVVKILAGQEMGIGAIAAMTGIYIVKGRVTLSANLMAAQIKRSRRYNYIIREITDAGCSIEFFENDRSIGFSLFAEPDAKAAGLLAGDNWRKFPRNMYFARAMSNGAKWYCPDVFSGPVYTPDELGPLPAGASYVDTATGEVTDQQSSAPIGDARYEQRTQPELTPAQQNALRKAQEREAKARGDQARAMEAKPEPTRAELIDGLKTLWEREKAIDAHSIPVADLTHDLDIAPIDVIRELGRNAQSRLKKLREAQPA